MRVDSWPREQRLEKTGINLEKKRMRRARTDMDIDSLEKLSSLFSMYFRKNLLIYHSP